MMTKPNHEQLERLRTTPELKAEAKMVWREALLAALRAGKSGFLAAQNAHTAAYAYVDYFDPLSPESADTKHRLRRELGIVRPYRSDRDIVADAIFDQCRAGRPWEEIADAFGMPEDDCRRIAHEHLLEVQRVSG